MLKPADGLAVHRVFVFGGREQSRFQPRLVAWSVLGGRQSIEENMQCEQHQSQADCKGCGTHTRQTTQNLAIAPRLTLAAVDRLRSKEGLLA
jgi:hypothetical protein